LGDDLDNDLDNDSIVDPDSNAKLSRSGSTCNSTGDRISDDSSGRAGWGIVSASSVIVEYLVLMSFNGDASFDSDASFGGDASFEGDASGALPVSAGRTISLRLCPLPVVWSASVGYSNTAYLLL